uniref:Uncharacterized protein n=1 Tax=Moniliophthora roreri TaxID=221103 RepID=A0A0W0FUY5_MONRR
MSNSTCVSCKGTGITPPLPTLPPPNTTVLDLLQTNDVPSAAAERLIRDTLTDINGRIEVLDDEISRLEERMRVIQQQKDQLVQLSSGHKAIVHPLRGIPEEVLLHIFRCCDSYARDVMDLTGTPICYDSLQQTRSPWNLGQVCRRWRMVVLSCSSLWSYVGVSMSSCEKLSRLALQLERSGSHPLTVALQAKKNVFTPAEKQLLDILCSHSNRWKTLRIHFHHGIMHNFQVISPMIKGRLPVLCQLSLVLDFQSQNDAPEDAVIDAFEIAPQLCDVVIAKCTNRLARILRLPWHQITRYRGFTNRGSSSHRVVIVNDDCQFLVQMPSVRAIYESRPINRVAAFPQLHLPSVHTFGIAIRSHSRLESINSFFDHLSLPNMCDFRLEVHTETVPECILAFLARSASKLRIFWFKPTLDWPDKDKVHLLKGTPSVQSLWLYCPTAELLGVLADCDSSVLLFPRLQEIGLFNLEKDWEGLITNLIERRRSTANTLRKVWLPCDHPFDSSQLNVWRSGGVVVDTSIISWYIAVTTV